jgi:hypothetical protein
MIALIFILLPILVGILIGTPLAYFIYRDKPAQIEVGYEPKVVRDEMPAYHPRWIGAQ